MRSLRSGKARKPLASVPSKRAKTQTAPPLSASTSQQQFCGTEQQVSGGVAADETEIMRDDSVMEEPNGASAVEKKAEDAEVQAAFQSELTEPPSSTEELSRQTNKTTTTKVPVAPTAQVDEIPSSTTVAVKQERDKNQPEEIVGKNTTVVPNALEIGQRVYCLWPENRLYYPGKIDAVYWKSNGKKSVGVKYSI